MDTPILALATSISFYLIGIIIPIIFVYSGVYKNFKFLSGKDKKELSSLVSGILLSFCVVYISIAFLLLIIATAVLSARSSGYVFLVYFELVPAFFISFILMIFTKFLHTGPIFLFPLGIFSIFCSVWFYATWLEVKKNNKISKKELLKLMSILSCFIIFFSSLSAIFLDKLHNHYKYCPGQILCSRINNI